MPYRTPARPITMFHLFQTNKQTTNQPPSLLSPTTITKFSHHYHQYQTTNQPTKFTTNFNIPPQKGPHPALIIVSI